MFSSSAPSFLFREGSDVSLGTHEPHDFRGEVLVLFIRDGKGLNQDLPLADVSLGEDIREFMDGEHWRAKKGEVQSFRVFGRSVKRVVLVGLGKESVDWRLAGAAAGGALCELSGSAGIALTEGADTQALVEGLLMRLHADTRFHGTLKKAKAEKENKLDPPSLHLLGAADGAEAVTRAQAVASGVIFARELVNGSANLVTPGVLADTAVDLAARCGMTAEILDEEQCEALGMNSFLAVGRASEVPSKLIHLTYSNGEPKRKIGIVGKGVTFDSGGYNLKVGPRCLIEMMKFDMGGSAATLGAAAAIAQLGPKDVEVHFVTAACENMVSGRPGALHPGDVITAMNGTTIEVNNTDAEGRLTLADALLFCQDKGVTEVVDVATLTGACVVALGSDIAGMWTNCDRIASHLEASSKATGEKLWRMPLEEDYMELLKSDLADMKNSASGDGGAITAALFLQKFVKKEVSWAHLDIAGTVWADKAKGVNPKCATGSMVRTLTDFVVSR